MLRNEHLTRQEDLINTDAVTASRVDIVGVGAIGSFLTLQLAKMGVTNIRVFDFDDVDIVNMNSQFYRFKDIGLPKVDALANIVAEFTQVQIKPFYKKVEIHDMPFRKGGIAVASVDDMAVRKQLLDQAIRSEAAFFIDPRMAAEDAALYVVDLSSENAINKYEKSLYSNTDAVQERCTAKATIYTSNLLSGLCAKYIKNIICKEQVPSINLWSIANNDLVVMK